jgi:drug/metabolite transporter (DMT)-like permease
VRAFHANWAYAVVVVNFAAAGWGLLRTRRRPSQARAFWWLAVAGQLAVGVQVILGVALHQRTPAPGRHMFYGFVLAIAAVLAHAFRGPDPKRNVIIFSAIALFLGAVGIRTMTTA